MVSYTLDTLPPMTEEDKARLAALAKRPDSEIDLSDPDCPELTDEQWARAIPNPFCKARSEALQEAKV